MVSGRTTGLLGTHSPTFAPYGGFRTADGWVVLAGAGSEDLWARACRALGREELTGDVRFADNARRVAHRDELTREIEATLRTRPTAHWLALFARAGVPAAEIKDMAHALSQPQVAALGSIQELDHPAAGAHRLIGPPLRIDREKLGYPAPAPTLGSDSRAVLTEAGLAPADIDRLVADGVVVVP
jgi:crotonobetainyl-CoA:carnitine CoA-transferase CaiB-like acyl-CoA transferase